MPISDMIKIYEMIEKTIVYRLIYIIWVVDIEGAVKGLTWWKHYHSGVSAEGASDSAVIEYFIIIHC